MVHDKIHHLSEFRVSRTRDASACLPLRIRGKCKQGLCRHSRCFPSTEYFLVDPPVEGFTPSVVAAGIETRTWVIAEHPTQYDFKARVILTSDVRSERLLVVPARPNNLCLHPPQFLEPFPFRLTFIKLR